MAQGIFMGALLGILLSVALGAMASTFSRFGERFWRVVTWVVIGAAVAAALVVLVSGAMGDPANRVARRGVGFGLFAAAFIVAAASRSWWQDARRGRGPRRRRALASSSGLLGPGAIALAAGGYFAYRGGHGPIAGIVAALGFGGYAILTVIEMRRGRRVMHRVRARIADARHWPLPEPPSEEGAKPWEDDRVTGLWERTRVWVALVMDGAVARAELERWPAEIGARGRNAGADRVATGDEAFDRSVVLEGDEAAWRPILDADVRRRLVQLVGQTGAVIAAGGRIVECAVSESHVSMLPRLLDDMAALAAALPAPTSDPRARVLALTASEPLARVRQGHYTWLEGQQWNTPAVLRAAAHDPDPDIAAWARDRLPPEDGVYR